MAIFRTLVTPPHLRPRPEGTTRSAAATSQRSQPGTTTDTTGATGAGVGGTEQVAVTVEGEEGSDGEEEEGQTGHRPTRTPQERLARLHRRRQREAAQSEELLDLNRAILMSLQEAPTTDPTASATPLGGDGSAGEVESEEVIGALMAMGFERSMCIVALRRARGDVNRAADILLSAS